MSARSWIWIARAGGAALGALLLLATMDSPADAQTCESNLQQVRQAQTDSDQALAQVRADLDAFADALVQPRSGPLTADRAVQARVAAETYVGALNSFHGQASQVAALCGGLYTQDMDRLTSTIAALQDQRARSDRLIEDYNALVASGEPAMTGPEIREVQIRLAERGLYSGGITGTLTADTRTAIRAFQQAAGFPATGYLPADQRRTLLQIQLQPPAVAQPVTPVQPTQPGGQVTAQVCATNLAALQGLDTEADRLLREMTSRLNAFDNALRGPRTGQFDPTLPAEIGRQAAAEAAEADQIYQQAAVYENLCGVDFNAALERGLGRVLALQQMGDRALQSEQLQQQLAQAGEAAMSAQQMRGVQQALRDLGYYTGGIDAIFGRGTRSAIQAFQRDYGYAATGFISPVQRDRLLAEQAARAAPPPVAAAPVAPVAPPVAAPAPEPPRRALPRFRMDDLAEILAEDAEIELPPELRPRANLEEPFEAVYDLALTMLADGNHLAAWSQRFRLFGAAYLEAGPESLQMIDAHLLLAQILAGLEEPELASEQLELADALIQLQPGENAYERAWVLERQASLRLSGALARAGSRRSIPARDFEEVAPLLEEALAVADAGLRASDPLTRRILDRLAAVHIAANVEPEDDRIWDSVAATFD